MCSNQFLTRVTLGPFQRVQMCGEIQGDEDHSHRRTKAALRDSATQAYRGKGAAKLDMEKPGKGPLCAHGQGVSLTPGSFPWFISQ